MIVSVLLSISIFIIGFLLINVFYGILKIFVGGLLYFLRLGLFFASLLFIAAIIYKIFTFLKAQSIF